MNRSPVVGIELLVLVAGYVAFRATTHEMGKVYVRAVDVNDEAGEYASSKHVGVDPSFRDEDGVELSWPRTIGLWVAGFLTLFTGIVEKLAVVHNATNRRICIGRYLNEIQACCFGLFQGCFQPHDANLFALLINETDGMCGNLIVYALLFIFRYCFCPPDTIKPCYPLINSRQKASGDIAPRSSPSRVRTATCWASTSRSPRTRR